MVETLTFILISIPTMILLGLRHALDVDHITAIDNLVRLHSSTRKSQLIGAGFSLGHMISVLAEMILIIYFIGSITRVDQLSFWGGVIGAIALGVIGAINIYSMKKWGKTGSAILASKILARIGVMKPFSSALIAGMVFGLGFDTRAFRFMAYSLSGAALTVAAVASYETITNSEILPDITGSVLAVTIIVVSFGYAYAARKRLIVNSNGAGSDSQIKNKRQNDGEDERLLP